MQESRADAGEQVASDFLDHVTRRSGLLLPRGEDQYAFVHLTFQEYFAALYLREEICSPEFVEDKQAADPRISTNTLYQWSGSTLWHETLLFLHELAANTPRWAKRIETWVFGDYELLTADDSKEDWNRLALRVQVADDSHSGLSEETRRAAFDHACKSLSALDAVELSLNSFARSTFKALCKSPLGVDFLISQISLNPKGIIQLYESGDNLQKILSAPCITNYTWWLILEETGISNLEYLTGYRDLNKLELLESHITNIEGIIHCQGLMWIDINCPKLRDISPLLQCKSIKLIELYNSDVRDLSAFIPLAVRVLTAEGTHVTKPFLSPNATHVCAKHRRSAYFQTSLPLTYPSPLTTALN